MGLKRSGSSAALVNNPSPSAQKGKLVKTGNHVVDSIRSAQAELANEFIEVMLNDVSEGFDILPVYNYYKKYKKELMDNDASGSADVWAALSTLKGIDVEYLVDWLCKHSDLAVDELLKVAGKDPSNLLTLLSAAIQVKRQSPLPAKLKTKGVMTLFLNRRAEEFGGRLKTFRQRGGLLGDGKVDFKHLLGYTVTYDADGKVTQITHTQTKDTVAIAKKYGLTHDYQIAEAWDDLNAAFSLHPMPPVKLASFFQEAGTGPWKQRHYVGKTFRQLAEDVEKMSTEYQQGVAAAKSQGSVVSAGVKEKVQESKHAKDKALMDKARDAAKKKISERRAGTAVSLKQAASASAA